MKSWNELLFYWNMELWKNPYKKQAKQHRQTEASTTLEKSGRQKSNKRRSLLCQDYQRNKNKNGNFSSIQNRAGEYITSFAENAVTVVSKVSMRLLFVPQNSNQNGVQKANQITTNSITTAKPINIHLEEIKPPYNLEIWQSRHQINTETEVTEWTDISKHRILKTLLSKKFLKRCLKKNINRSQPMQKCYTNFYSTECICPSKMVG